MSLFEFRLYVARPGTIDLMLDRWANYHRAIYPDFHVVLGSFVTHIGDEPDPIGFGMLLEHEDRAAVDRSMQALIASDRMNQVPGPPGTAYVERWERTFLHPLDVTGLVGLEAAGQPRLHELRTLVSSDSRWDELSELCTSRGPGALVDDAGVLGSFVSHPERHEPNGVSLLVRHDEAAVVPDSTDAPPASVRATTQTAAALPGVDHIVRTFLTPTSYSNL